MTDKRPGGRPTKYSIFNKDLALSKLEPFEGNPQKMTDDQFDGLVESIKKNGWLLDDPVVWEYSENKYKIISGHHRISAAIEAGINKKSCKVISGIDEKEARLLVIEGNQRKGFFDDGQLNVFLNETADKFEIDNIFDLVGIDDIFCDIDTHKAKKINLKPYEKIHILLSVDVDRYIDIKKDLEKIIEKKFVEYEQSQN